MYCHVTINISNEMTSILPFLLIDERARVLVAGALNCIRFRSWNSIEVRGATSPTFIFPRVSPLPRFKSALAGLRLPDFHFAQSKVLTEFNSLKKVSVLI